MNDFLKPYFVYIYHIKIISIILTNIICIYFLYVDSIANHFAMIATQLGDRLSENLIIDNLCDTFMIVNKNPEDKIIFCYWAVFNIILLLNYIYANNRIITIVTIIINAKVAKSLLCYIIGKTVVFNSLLFGKLCIPLSVNKVATISSLILYDLKKTLLHHEKYNLISSISLNDLNLDLYKKLWTEETLVIEIKNALVNAIESAIIKHNSKLTVKRSFLENSLNYISHLVQWAVENPILFTGTLTLTGGFIWGGLSLINFEKRLRNNINSIEHLAHTNEIQNKLIKENMVEIELSKNLNAAAWEENISNMKEVDSKLKSQDEDIQSMAEMLCKFVKDPQNHKYMRRIKNLDV